MRRLPIYLLVDISGSMHGEPIEAVKNGLQTLVSALRRDPQALETAYLSVITFETSAKQIIPLTDLTTFQVPSLQAGGCTALGEALDLLCDRVKDEVVKTTPERKGDWRPMVFIFTDGQPTDDPKSAIAKFRSMKWGTSVSCAAGTGCDVSVLEQITPECVVQLDTADANTISAFFKWVSSSVSTASKSIGGGKEVEGLDELPLPPPEVKVV